MQLELVLFNLVSKNACSRVGRQVELSPAALERLVAFDWPGNVRQFEITVDRLVLFSRGTVIDEYFLPAFHHRHDSPFRPRGRARGTRLA